MGVSPMDLFLHGRDARATMISPPNQHERGFLAAQSRCEWDKFIEKNR
jgi:hypothetical protein